LEGLDYIIGYAVKANNNFKIMQVPPTLPFYSHCSAAVPFLLSQQTLLSCVGAAAS
jgi:hypothetical protein